MHKIDRIARRRFLKTAAAAGCMSVANVTLGLSSHTGKSSAFRLVAETDRKRILEAAAQYVSQTQCRRVARFLFPGRLLLAKSERPERAVHQPRWPEQSGEFRRAS